ncbi:MAG: RNA polymerase sigma factor [Solirubrobacteraceae bacterium]
MEARCRFEALYLAHAGAVRTYVRRRSDVEATEDVVADVFVVAWRRLDDIPDDPLPWLLGVARRVLANQRRGASRDAALRDRIMSDLDRAPSAELILPESGKAVLRALSVLREQDREALLLVAWEGLEPGQAARVMGVRANTFAARLSRARRRFARALAADRDRSDQELGPVKAEVVR